MSGRRNFKIPKLTYGHGINDADYVTQVKSTGWNCPFFLTWKNMLKRAYSKAEHERRPSYIGATVCDEWLSFSAFRSWMESQGWEGLQLDKDLLVRGNKEYRPDRCCFVSHRINSFLTDSSSTRGDLPIGVCLHKATGKYAAQVQDIGGRSRHVGLFSDPNDAHLAWAREKHNIALILADSESDPRVSAALSSRYSNYNHYQQVTP